jgi:hypothetical protein
MLEERLLNGRRAYRRGKNEVLELSFTENVTGVESSDAVHFHVVDGRPRACEAEPQPVAIEKDLRSRRKASDSRLE